MNAILVIGVVLTLVVQRLLGAAGSPLIGSLVLLPMPWIVGPALKGADRRWFIASFAIGLLWDAVLEEPVIGPGAIAWSAASALLWWLAGTIADRSSWMWFIGGALGALAVVALRFVSQWPLGLAQFMALPSIAAIATATGVWCALVGWLLASDVPSRWRRHRARRLR